MVCFLVAALKPSVTENPLKLRDTREERESEWSQISLKDFGWRNAGGVEKRARADWGSVRKRVIESGMFSDGSNTIPGHVPVQGLNLEARGDRAS